jgi:hypothetical protein
VEEIEAFQVTTASDGALLREGTVRHGSALRTGRVARMDVVVDGA